jgi:hypothetical protein
VIRVSRRKGKNDYHLYPRFGSRCGADAFVGIMICFVVATLMVPLMRKVAAPTAPTSHKHPIRGTDMSWRGTCE